MNHPIFGSIEQDEQWRDLGWWNGRVQVPFFSGYDTVASDKAAELSGTKNWQKSPDDRHERGDFELCVINEAGGEPSAQQERVFVHFLENQDTICNAVIQTIFRYYQSNWGYWRSGDAGHDLSIPELQSLSDLKTVVRFAGLYVYDDSNGGGAILGFCFECTWDIEHGLGVLVRDGRVIKLGENDICWSGPTAAGLPFALDSDPAMQTSEQKAIAAAKVLEQKTGRHDQSTRRRGDA